MRRHGGARHRRPTSGGCERVSATSSSGPRSRGHCRPVGRRRTDSPRVSHPLDRVTGRLPRRLRIAVDWIVTIVGAVAIVLAIKVGRESLPHPVVLDGVDAPLRETRARMRVAVLRPCSRKPVRLPLPGSGGDVIVFETPPAAQAKCGAGGTFVKRIVGLPGERVAIRLRRGAAFVYIDGKRLEEPYIENDRRDIGPEDSYRVPAGHYFVMGDNRSQSCDSRVWGSVPEDNLIGKVFMTYWPPQRISFR